MGLLLAALVVGSVVLFVFLIYSSENANPLRRRAEIVKILIDIFNAEPVSKNIMKFKIKTFDFFIEINIDFKQAFQLANVETINFHIPKDQFERVSTKPGIALHQNKINGIQTYLVYQTHGDGLTYAKKKLEEIISGARPAANKQVASPPN